MLFNDIICLDEVMAEEDYNVFECLEKTIEERLNLILKKNFKMIGEKHYLKHRKLKKISNGKGFRFDKK